MRKLFALLCITAVLTVVSGCKKEEPAKPATPAPAGGGATN
jgi:hypothetical protein